jgi:AbrB family looped-hinge helix DNA binding protein
MADLIVSSKGQIVIPAEIRHRLGLGAGTRLEIREESDGLKLSVLRPAPRADIVALAGMVTAPVRGAPRRLEDFDAASLASRERRGRP